MTDTNADMDVKPEEQTIVVEKRDDGIVRPGDLSAKLQACRERAELDQEQAATAMRLSPAMIKALETENFADLPDPPYVRGYLRSYARLDESDPKDLIRTYELLRGADPDSLSTPAPMALTRVNKPSISPTTVRMLGLVALVLLLGVLSMIPGINQWVKQTWHSFAAAQPGSAPTTVTSQTIATVANPTTPATSTSTDLTASDPVPASAITSPALASTTQDSPSSTTPSEAVLPATTMAANASETTPATLGLTIPAASTLGSTEATNSSTAATPTTAASTASTVASSGTTGTSPTTLASATTDPAITAGTGLADPNAPTTTVDPTKPTDATATTQQPIDGEVMVRMEFTQEVWMQVKDGTNKSIFESLNSPNTWKQFKTRTPLTFKIGNAPGVKLYLNGQSYDHAKYTRGSVARFTVN